jgi:dolichol-phosphate mannosyltransferase
LKLKITIVMPTYNEAENLPKMADTLLALPLKNLNLLVVDDNSADGTGTIADMLAQKYPGKLTVIHREGKLGLGTAYIDGFKHLLQGDSDVIGQMDADFSHPPEKIIELVEALNDCDVAVGSRYIPGGSLDEHWPLWRKGLSSFANFYARAILNLPIKDTTGAFRLIKRDALKKLPLDRIRSNGYVFQVELAYLMHKVGLSFKEVPIYFKERELGASKMSFGIQLEAALRVWALLWQYRDL